MGELAAGAPLRVISAWPIPSGAGERWRTRQTLTEPESKSILAAYGIPVAETRIARELREFGPAARDIGHPVALKILSVELDVNPLLADRDGVIALDARVRLEPTAMRGSERFAIRPYPMELEEEAELERHALRLRPIRPEDFAQHKRFLSRCSPEDLHARFLSTFRELPDADIARLTQIDYDREMAFIAEESLAPGGAETLGVARVSTDPDNLEAEFAVLVRSDMKRHGLGHLLLAKLIRYCRARGTARLTSSVLSGNARMLGLGSALGFTARLAERGIMEMSLDLQPSGASRRAGGGIR